MPNSIVHTAFGAFCSVCQSPLSLEEEDFGVCDACDGEGIGGSEDDEFDYDNDPARDPGCVTPQDTTPPELKQVLAEALAKAGR